MAGNRSTQKVAEAFDTMVNFLESLKGVDVPRQRAKVLYTLGEASGMGCVAASTSVFINGMWVCRLCRHQPVAGDDDQRDESAGAFQPFVHQ